MLGSSGREMSKIAFDHVNDQEKCEYRLYFIGGVASQLIEIFSALIVIYS